MKQISLVTAFIAFTASASYATVVPKKSNEKLLKVVLGRECCTKTGTWGDNGATITVTACAGWFLSNSENAYARACEKAEEALNYAQ